MKEQKTTKWSNFNPLCLARHVLRNLWMTVLAGLICVMAVYLLQTLVSKPSYDSQVTFAVTSRSASATASGSIAVTDSVASQFGELLQSNPVRTAAAAEMGLNVQRRCAGEHEHPHSDRHCPDAGACLPRGAGRDGLL